MNDLQDDALSTLVTLNFRDRSTLTFGHFTWLSVASSWMDLDITSGISFSGCNFTRRFLSGNNSVWQDECTNREVYVGMVSLPKAVAGSFRIEWQLTDLRKKVVE